LWIVVPVALIAWPFVRARQRNTRTTVGQYLGWVDLNLIACAQRLATPILVRHPLAWTPSGDMAGVTHRLRMIDPA
jgi:hypothetical protein